MRHGRWVALWACIGCARLSAAAYCDARIPVLASNGSWSQETGKFDVALNDTSSCTLRVWDEASIEKCLDRSWLILFGSSNTYFMTLQLLSLLGVAPNATLFDELSSMAVRDFVVENDAVVHAKGEQAGSQYYSSSSDVNAFKLVLESAPPARAWTRTIRITMFDVSFWEQMDAPLDAVECALAASDDSWRSSEISLLTSIGSAYEECAASKASSCLFATYRDASVADALLWMQRDMRRNVLRLNNFCAKDQLRHHGCTVMTTQSQTDATWNNATMALAGACLAGSGSHFRLFDVATFANSLHTVGGYQDIVSLTWTWMWLISGACARSKAAQADGLSFSGDNCSSASLVANSSLCEVSTSCSSGTCTVVEELDSAVPPAESSASCPIAWDSMCSPLALEFDDSIEFALAQGEAQSVCRGQHQDDNSVLYYDVHEEVYTLAECKSKCVATAGCTGLEFNAELPRCEVWRQVINFTLPLQGFSCLTYSTTTSTTMATLPGETTTTADVPFCDHRVALLNLSGTWQNSHYIGNTMQDGSGTPCLARLWDQTSIEACMDSSWIVLLGGSNTALMVMRLLWLLGLSASAELVRETFASDFADFIVEDDAVVYQQLSLIGAGATLWDSETDAERIQTLLAAAPAANSAASRSIRITYFRARFWEHAEAALGGLECHAASASTWTQAPISLTLQVAAWYNYCSIWRYSWCLYTPYNTMEAVDAYAAYETSLERMVPRLEAFCGLGGRAEQHGCTFLTWQSDADSEWNRITVSTMQRLGCDSNHIRTLDVATLIQNDNPYARTLAGHSDQVGATWIWMLLFSGSCPTTTPAQGNTLVFDSVCEGDDYELEVLRSCAQCGQTVPCQESCMSPGFEALCPSYIDFCGLTVSGCRNWECVHAAPCGYTVGCQPSLGSCSPTAELDTLAVTSNPSCSATAPTCTTTGNSTSRTGFWLLGEDRACRGDNITDNEEAYFIAHLSVANLTACEELCEAADVCHGIEFWEDFGRCEVWQKQVRATAEAGGFVCYSYVRPTTSTTAADQDGTITDFAQGRRSPLVIVWPLMSLLLAWSLTSRQ